MWKRQMIPGAVKRVISDDEFFEKLRLCLNVGNLLLSLNHLLIDQQLKKTVDDEN